MAITYFAVFADKTFLASAFKRVIFVVRHTRAPVLAWRRQTRGLKEQQILDQLKF